MPNFDPDKWLAEKEAEDAKTSASSAFDPDAYLADKQQQVAQPEPFDPDKYLGEKTTPVSPQTVIRPPTEEEKSGTISAPEVKPKVPFLEALKSVIKPEGENIMQVAGSAAGVAGIPTGSAIKKISQFAQHPVVPKGTTLKETLPDVGRKLIRGALGVAAGTEEAIAMAGGALQVGAAGLPENMGGSGLDIAQRATQAITGVSSPKAQDIVDRIGKIMEREGTYGYDFYNRLVEKFPVSEKVYGGSFEENPSIVRALGTVAEAVPSLFAAIGVGIATGGAASAAGLSRATIPSIALGALESNYLEAYRALTEAGLPEQRAKVQAVGWGLINTAAVAALERLPLEKFLGGGTSRIWRDSIAGAALEGITEGLQQIAQNLTAYLGYDETRKFFSGVIESMIGGFGAGGLAGAATSAYEANRQKWVRAELTEAEIDAQARAIKEVVQNGLKQVNEKAGVHSADTPLFMTQQEIAEAIDLAETGNVPAAPMPIKDRQLQIINENNPAPNDTQTWIRKVEDIKTAEEVLTVFEAATPDFTQTQANEALNSGRITVYSSNPIQLGTFVTPSLMKAQNYAGNGQVYAKNININDVAWIDGLQGQFTGTINQNEVSENMASNTAVAANQIDQVEMGDSEALEKLATADSNANVVDIPPIPVDANGNYEFDIYVAGKRTRARYNVNTQEYTVKGINITDNMAQQALDEWLRTAASKRGSNIAVSIQGLDGLYIPLPVAPLTNARITPQQIQDNISKMFDDMPIVPFVYDRFGKAVAGTYSVNQDFIKTRKPYDVEALAHEAAHAIQERILQMANISRNTRTWQGDFIDALFDVYATVPNPTGSGVIAADNALNQERMRGIKNELRDLDYDQRHRRMTEGWAEFMRLYLTNPIAAKNKAPKTYQALQDTMTRGTNIRVGGADSLANKIKSIKKDYSTYFAQGFLRINAQRIVLHPEERPLETKFSEQMKTLRQDFVDLLAALNDFVTDMFGQDGLTDNPLKAPIKPSENPARVASDLAMRAKTVVDIMARKGMMNGKLERTGKALVDILAKIPVQHQQAFWSYAVSLVDVRRGCGNLSGATGTPAQIVAQYESVNPTWAGVVKEISDWNFGVLKYMYELGGISKESYDRIVKDNPLYVPMVRVFDNFRKNAVLAGVEGSTRDIANPLTAMLQLAYTKIELAHRAKIFQLIFDMQKRNPKKFSRYATKSNAPTKVTQTTANRLVASLKQAGFDVQVNTNDNTITMDGTPVDVYYEDFMPDIDNGIYPVLINGKRHWYQIHDPKLKKALFTMETQSQNKIVQFLAPFARMVRMGATQLKAAFAIGNFLRDAGARFIFTNAGLRGMNPFDSFIGVAQIIKNDYGKIFGLQKNPMVDEFLDWSVPTNLVLNDKQQSTALQDAFLRDMLMKQGKYLAAAVDTYHVVKNPQNAITTAFNRLTSVASNTIDAMREIIGVAEQAPRLREYLEVYDNLQKLKKEGKIDWSEQDIKLWARNMADDVTLNFRLGGSTVLQHINPVSAFTNAMIRGVEKIQRSLRTHPVRTIGRGLLAVSFPVFLQALIYRDEEWWKNLDPNYRNSNLFVRLDEDTIFRIPLPYDIAPIFGMIPKSVFDAVNEGDKQYLEGVYQGFLTIMNPADFIPSALRPIADILANRTYAGRPIETTAMQYMAKVDRVRPYTSRFAIYSSAFLNAVAQTLDESGQAKLSPVQLEYAFNQYTGSLYSEGVRAIEFGKMLYQWALEGGDSLDFTLQSSPVLGGFFVRQPKKPARQQNEFFARVNYLQQMKQSDRLTRSEEKEWKDIFEPALKEYKEKVSKPMKEINLRYAYGSKEYRLAYERLYAIEARIFNRALERKGRMR